MELGRSSEDEIKAAMIYNFASFVEWPEHAPQSRQPAFVIGVLGDDPIESILDDALRGETFQGRKIQIRHLSALNAMRACNIVFISQSEKKRTPEVIDALRGESVLTVGDTEDFTKLGGMLAFTKEGKKVRFRVNPDAAARAGLKISSKLLHLAILDRDAGSEKGN